MSDLAEYVEAFDLAHDASEDAHWARGDLFNEAEAEHGSGVVALIEHAESRGMPGKDLRREARVAKVFHREFRDLAPVWSMYRAVVNLAQRQPEDALDALQRAGEGAWSVAEFTAYLRATYGRDPRGRATTIAEPDLAMDQYEYLRCTLAKKYPWLRGTRLHDVTGAALDASLTWRDHHASEEAA